MEKTFFDKNYFELFSLPVSFSIDQLVLEKSYKHLHGLVHPDRYANKTALEKRMVMQMAAQVNTAYRCLKNPLLRAEYMLSLQGEILALEKQTAHDMDFLQQQIVWRERLQNQDASLVDEIEKVYQRYINELHNGFENDMSVDLLKKKIFELRFVDKLKQEIKTRII